MIAYSIGLMYNTGMGTQWNMSKAGRAKISASAKQRYKNSSKLVNCLNCSLEYRVALSRWLRGRGRYCSKKCMTENFQGRHLSSKSEFKKGLIPWNKGIKYPKVAGENHSDWKGDKVGYSGLHKWVKRNYKFNETCEHCGGDRKLHLANRTGIYDREFENWIILCKSCHIKFDNKNPKKPPYKMRKGW